MTRRQILTCSIAVALLLASTSQAVPPLDLCTIPVYMNVDGEIERCYISCISVRARANIEAEFGLRIDEVDPQFEAEFGPRIPGFMDWNAYFDGSNQIPGDSSWHTLSVCVVALNPRWIWEARFLEGPNPPDPKVLVGRVTITVRPLVESMPVGFFVQIENCSNHEFLLQPVECVIDVDIKPQSCPNPLNVESKGVLPVAILGSADFDVHDIDVASIRLADVAPIRSSLEDVATPVDGEECECTEEGLDGYTDLTLNFETEEIADALGEVVNGEVLLLTLTGDLSDGTPIEGEDCIRVKKRRAK